MGQEVFEKPRAVLVTGAGGAMGRALALELFRRGHEVRVSVHKATTEPFPPQIDSLNGDLRDGDLVSRAVKGVDWVFHLAAKLHINDPGENLAEEYESVNVGITKALLRSSATMRDRFIFASTINVYGPGEPGVVFDETSPVRPNGLYAETKARAERAVLESPDGVVLRFGAVYGRNMKGNFPLLVNALRKRTFAYVGKAENRRTLIHEADAVRAAITCAADDNSRGRVYNVTDGKVHTLEEIVEAICKAIGRRPPKVKVPETAARKLFAGADKVLGRLGKDTRLTPLIEKINEDIAVDGYLIRSELGFVPQFELEKGWKDAVGGRKSENEE